MCIKWVSSEVKNIESEGYIWKRHSDYVANYTTYNEKMQSWIVHKSTGNILEKSFFKRREAW